MNCPQCGSSTVADQLYCRSCGNALSTIPSCGINLNNRGALALIMLLSGVFAAMSGKMFDLKWLIFAGIFVMLAGAYLLAVFAFRYDARARDRRSAGMPRPR